MCKRGVLVCIGSRMRVRPHAWPWVDRHLKRSGLHLALLAHTDPAAGKGWGRYTMRLAAHVPSRRRSGFWPEDCWKAVIRKAAPDAKEVISYRMPAFRRRGMLVYFAAVKDHIGVFPPVRGDVRLDKALARYKGPKGNLRFPLDEPVPLALIERITKLRVKQDATKAGTRSASDIAPTRTI